MTKMTSVILATLSLCAVAGCNRGTNNSAAPANNAANAAAPAKGNNVSANAAAPATGPVSVALMPGGLEARMNGALRPLNFGAPASEAVNGLTAILGAPVEDASNSECGGGQPVRIVRWSNGLRILAQGNQFKGWETDQPGLDALGDLQVGIGRAQLDADQPSIEQTSLGTEWTVGDGEVTVSGLLSDDTPNGRVTHMWAGITCHMT